MSRAARLFDRLDDAMNPIVVKELRQAVQGRFVSVVLTLFLLVELGMLGIFLVAEGGDTSADFTAGRDMFVASLGILLGTCFMFIPAYAGVRLSAERSDTNVDLLFITTIPPRAILWGKLLAAMVLAVLIYSACVPFMAMAYLLRGIDLPTMIFLMAMNLVIIAAAVQIALFLACLPATSVLRLLLGVLALGGYVGLTGGMVAQAYEMIDSGPGIDYGSRNFWLGAAVLLLMIGAGMGLLFVLSVALLKPPSSNRALPVRLYVTALWLIFGGLALGMTYYYGRIYGGMGIHFGDELVASWVVGSVSLLLVGLLVASGERDAPGLRVASTIPRRAWLRAPTFLVYSGAAGGTLWGLLLIALTLGLGLAWFRAWGGGDLEYVLYAMTCISLYVLAYTLAAAVIRRALLPKLKPQVVPALALMLAVLASALPPLLATMIYGVDELWRPGVSNWFLGSPTAVLIDSAYREPCLVLGGIAAAAAAVLNVPWVIRSFRAFRRYEGSMARVPVAEPVIEPAPALAGPEATV